MLSQISASLSHPSSLTAFTFRSSLRPKFRFFSFNLHNRRSSTVVSMDGSSFPAAASVSKDLNDQTLRNNDGNGYGCGGGNNAKNIDISSQHNVKLKLEELRWDHSFVRELPGDPRTDLVPRQVFRSCYTKVSPSAEVDNPQLVAWSDSVAEILDLDPKEFERPDFPLILSGASPLVGAMPYAQCYGGHQFGMWAGQLGDGRAITLGEVLNSKSERWELQLKGAGKTPYSRFADGLAVLRSSIREFLCSEAIHSLGIPTTRALCLVTTGKFVTRDMFYEVAPSFLRFGSYQLHASRGKDHLGLVRTLADYAIRHHFPHLENLSKSDSLSFSTDEGDDSVVDLTSNKYAAWTVEVTERTASLIANWQGVGFTHGVLNTDNMSVLGLTIDYGPFGFLDAFDPSYTPNTTDLPGRRYCFANQPDIGLWNIAQFATTIAAAQLITDKEANYAMERYGTKFMDEYQAIMTKKLGLPKYNKQLIGELLKNMAVDKVDYTNFFRLLSNIKADPTIPEDELLIPLKAVLLDIGKDRKDAWASWLKSYIKELSASGISDEERKTAMNSVNPKYILRNYLCQSAIDAAEQGDFEEVRRLLKVMARPYDEQPEMEKYAGLPPAWAHRPGQRRRNLMLNAHLRYTRPQPQEKDQAIRVRISAGITSHKQAFNVDPDLSYFKHIVACGIADKSHRRGQSTSYNQETTPVRPTNLPSKPL
ncbi:protein adenylyltransferase SelO [Sesamum alatum]|uniref:Selenoprotein O n=1 Tax=Sesamum alatum TaxID=300844 RepID=A0AAE1Z447_9LAMI|nr:protein adenylyltransferase SelO [Sesamum alatum]